MLLRTGQLKALLWMFLHCISKDWQPKQLKCAAHIFGKNPFPVEERWKEKENILQFKTSKEALSSDSMHSFTFFISFQIRWNWSHNSVKNYCFVHFGVIFYSLVTHHVDDYLAVYQVSLNHCIAISLSSRVTYCDSTVLVYSHLLKKSETIHLETNPVK